MKTRPHLVIAGGSGFLGRGLTRLLDVQGYDATILTRSAVPSGDFPTTASWRQWDGRTLGEWSACLSGAAAVINLVGRSVDCRKTTENVRAILESRVDSCRVLGQAMRTVDRPPPVWIQSATAHIIGDPVPKDKVCDESTRPGPINQMAPRVGVEWEKAFHEARLPDQRGVILRISFVLGARGGAMSRLRKLTRLGLGGTVGPGDQWISWIHQDDLNRFIVAAIQNSSYCGTYVLTAPQPVTNRQFMRAMRHAFHRPWSPPAPAVAVRLACRFLLFTDPELALMGRRCVPTRICKETDFQFQFPTLAQALDDLSK